SEENGRVLSATASKLGITDNLAYNTFALTIGDIILGTHSKESLGQMLKDRMDFNDEQVTVAEAGLRDFLNKLPNSKQGSDSSPVVFAPSPEPVVLEEAKPVTTTDTLVEPKDNSELKPLRTFAMDVDMSRVHGYGAFKSGEAEQNDDETPVHRSSQDDIINK